MKKIKDELGLIKSLKSKGLWLATCLTLQLIGILWLIFSRGILSDIGLLMGYSSLVAEACIALGTMEYAKFKSRSEYYGLLGILGFIIIFAFDSKKEIKKDIPVSRPLKLIDFILIAFYSLSLFSFSRVVIYREVYDERIFDSLFPHQFTVTLLAILIIPIWSLITNRRKIIPTTFLLTLIFFFIWFFTIGDQNKLIEVYKQMRNSFYFYFVIYAIFHLVIHSLAKLKTKTRKIITPQGIVMSNLIFVLNTYWYSIFELVARVFSFR